jgi:hypothetical protein
MEACWLAAAVTIPLFFDISSVQVFEPDKMFVLKFLAVLAGAARLLKWIDARRSKLEPALEAALEGRRLKLALVVAVLALAASYTVSSIFSIMPAQSWWGL